MPRIVAYLSHSYHPEDRAINMAIWRKLNSHDVAFAVDPPSLDRPMDVTFLERMMQRSHGFVAIVPDRSRTLGAPPTTHTWSPYQEFECRLAIRANKPRFIVVEKGIELGPLAEGQATRWFTRDPLEFDPDFDAEMERFVEDATARDREPATLPKMGILRWTPGDSRWDRLSTLLAHRLGREIAAFVDVDDEMEDHDLLNVARSHAVVVADIDPKITPADVLGLLHGAAIPMFRTCVLGLEEDAQARERQLKLRVPDSRGGVGLTTPADGVRLPLLFRGYQVDEGMRPILFWSEKTIEDTVERISAIIQDYRTRERRLETRENADDYFLKLRGNRVFISTSSDLSAWTTPLKAALDTAGMPAFHYKVPEIPVGEEWMTELRRRIAETDLFLAFLSPGYWKSPVCLEEMALAIDRWERHQLVITVGTPADRPPMPAFLGRYQTEALSEPERDVRSIVAHVQQRFRRAGRTDEESVRTIGTILARHLDAEGITDVAAFLASECHLPQAAELAAQTGHDPFKVVEALINRGRVEKQGGAALARLCFWMRRREGDPAIRKTLTQQFSLLRLVPKLHDVKAWNTRRLRTEVQVTIKSTAPRKPLETIVALAGNHADTLDAVRGNGAEIAGALDVPNAIALAGDSDCQVTVASTFDDLMIPVEWAVLPNMDAPLGRIRRLTRRVANLGLCRETIEELFEKDAAAPPRALLFGYGPPELPHVRAEIAALVERFQRRYGENEWPPEIVESIAGEGATLQCLRDTLADSDFDLLHLAGHAGWIDGKPSLQVSPGADGQSFVRSSHLAQWLQRSSVRFVYLSCCGGASVPMSQAQFAGWRQTFLRDLIEAGVPEVAGYFWPVSDQRATTFALRFYESFVQDFDASGAMLRTRRGTAADDPTWAGSLIVKSAP
jgi:hypothetical protein